MFYVLHIRSVLTYCVATFFPMLSNKQVDTLERTQSMCTKIIHPDGTSYTRRLEMLGIPTLKEYSLNQYRNKFLLIYATDHPLSNHRSITFFLKNVIGLWSKLIPPKQSSSRRHSARLKDAHTTRCNTKIRTNSFFLYGVKTFL